MKMMKEESEKKQHPDDIHIRFSIIKIIPYFSFLFV